jgi:thiol-disulfide isomerase/thioredoxin
MRYALPSIILSLAATVALPQTPAPHSDALDLLTRVAQHYADAKSYDLNASEEMSQSGDYQRMWNRTVIAAAEAPGGKYYYEAHGNMGGAIRISDGKTVWKYHVEENHYTARPMAETTAKPAGPIPIVESSLFLAENLRHSLANIARTLHSAALDPDETLTANGKPVRCQVIRIRNSDENRPDPNAQMERTVWIDEQRQTIVKIEDRRDIKHMNVPKGLPLIQVTTTIYTKTELDSVVPDSMFSFVPPAGAILIADFPDPRDGWGLSTMTGDLVPALKLKSSDGKTVPIESFRGKPVLIDFWATWCAPCVAGMPKLAEIYKEGKDKGLVLLSVDQDEDANNATGFLAKNGYNWLNFHDGDGEIAKLMGSSPLPRVILVDAKGQIVYDGTGGDEDRVRLHIAKLGPEFADLAPRPKAATPCNGAVSPGSSR